MQMYTVVGEYGPQGDMNITLEIEAENEGDAIHQFCETVEANYPHEWKRMGRRNVHCMGVVAPPVAKPIVQTLWRVKFSSRSDMVVTAATLLDVARHVDGYCKDTGTSPKDIVKIEYLAY